MKPAKPFATYEQQLDRLKNTKHLIIKDEATAQKTLRDISYYALIGGYKSLFYDPSTRTYLPGTTLNDIVALYQFDKTLRELLFSYLSIIEQKMRSTISYAFCETYSNLQSECLDPGHYQNTRKNQYNIKRLTSTLEYIAKKDNQHQYIVYQRLTYGNVPLYATAKAMTFGQISAMYSLLTPKLQINVVRQFGDISVRELIQFLRVLTHFRNICAHIERLFSYKDRYDIPDMPVHEEMEIPRKGQQYIYGKHDIFAVVIAFYYLLPGPEFDHFCQRLATLIYHTTRTSASLTEQKLLRAMGFPENWEDIRHMQ